MRLLTLARVDVCPGDLLRYLPRFADPYRGELAHVEEIIDVSEAGLSSFSPFVTPYWVRVRFGKNNLSRAFNAQSFVVEESRCTQSVRE